MTSFKDDRRKSPGYRAARIFRTNACLLDRQVSSLGLCHGQIPYLIAITEKEGQTQDELGASIRVTRAATARTLKGMEKAGLITRKENPDNRRQKLVYPTEQANNLMEKLHIILAAHNDLMLTGFSEEEKTQLFSLMDRLIDNVEDALKEGCNEHS